MKLKQNKLIHKREKEQAQYMQLRIRRETNAEMKYNIKMSLTLTKQTRDCIYRNVKR